MLMRYHQGFGFLAGGHGNYFPRKVETMAGAQHRRQLLFLQLSVRNFFRIGPDSPPPRKGERAFDSIGLDRRRNRVGIVGFDSGVEERRRNPPRAQPAPAHRGGTRFGKPAIVDIAEFGHAFGKPARIGFIRPFPPAFIELTLQIGRQFRSGCRIALDIS